MKTVVFVILLLQANTPVVAKEFSCRVLTQFANSTSNSGNRENSIIETYEQILRTEFENPSFNAVLHEMVNSKTPFDLPASANFDSETLRNSLQQFKELISSDVGRDTKLESKLIVTIQRLLKKTKTEVKRQEAEDQKTQRRYVLTVPWPTHIYRSYFHNGWLIGFPYLLNERTKIQLTENGKTIKQIQYQKHQIPNNGSLTWVAPENGNILFFNAGNTLFRIPIFDSNAKPLTETEGLKVEQTGILPTDANMGAPKLYFSPDGKQLIRTLPDRRLLLGKFTNENTLNYERELKPEITGDISDVQWLGNSHLLLTSTHFSRSLKRNLSVIALNPESPQKPISKLSIHPTGDSIFASPDGKDIYRLQYTGTIPKAVRLRDMNGSLAGRISRYSPKNISLGHKRKFKVNEGNPLVDRIYFPQDPTKVIQLFFHRDNTRAHDLVLRNREDFKEISRITLPESEVPPFIEMSPEGRFIAVNYENLFNEKFKPHALVVDTQTDF